MTATAAPIEKDQELMLNSLVESASVNSFAHFVASNEANQKNDFINTFICHLIFYAIFCITIVLHIFIDLGLGRFVKNKFLQLIEITKNIVVEKNPAFA